ncbi:MAG: hypothetical protein UR31_C0001G0009 [Parcubacteria group bacterium GW2011_GWA2_33_14]|uniref:Haem-binding uptake Tiki superfamily ChaN domain-containing protein n=1 Tax=Candidatus Staskawiczbacteria bacterium RIFCSPHIGHO2_02_FULL_33_16 TaxID=1802204 RepID=A0A1G2HU68_9BACT|nr:MAG: hypothetical protein UR31_C0001G0009 [Parcubacteria group bacterium GW2011_GWA2_33_14]OGZ66054.1 MAG: hypothetical protein A3D34_02635 [Candidatus Staskawiczbacteria bacterium RIFCSPHIGHO2_02_FULL_33_16]OGZ70805.1 MAG: hypothetical protein A2980_02125 [Candidatus Staskawiczbacteria bacterium RIFCSPLOWO2_01_FULL_33_13]
MAKRTEREAADILLSAEQKEVGAREYINSHWVESWNDKGYLIEHSDESNRYSIVIVGENHLMEEEWQKQAELIKIVKPEYVLHEWLGPLVYDPETKTFEGATKDHENYATDEIRIKSKIGPYGLPAELYDLAQELKFEIVGCDLSQKELRELEGRVGAEERGIKKEGIYMPGTDQQVVRIRDERMVKKIIEYQNKATRPIVVIVGWGHGTGIHDQQLLQQKGALGYIYVNQGIKNTEKK